MHQLFTCPDMLIFTNPSFSFLQAGVRRVASRADSARGSSGCPDIRLRGVLLHCRLLAGRGVSGGHSRTKRPHVNLVVCVCVDARAFGESAVSASAAAPPLLQRCCLCLCYAALVTARAQSTRGLAARALVAPVGADAPGAAAGARALPQQSRHPHSRTPTREHLPTSRRQCGRSQCSSGQRTSTAHPTRSHRHLPFRFILVSTCTSILYKYLRASIIRRKNL